MTNRNDDDDNKKETISNINNQKVHYGYTKKNKTAMLQPNMTPSLTLSTSKTSGRHGRTSHRDSDTVTKSTTTSWTSLILHYGFKGGFFLILLVIVSIQMSFYLTLHDKTTDISSRLPKTKDVLETTNPKIRLEHPDVKRRIVNLDDTDIGNVNGKVTIPTAIEARFGNSKGDTDKLQKLERLPDIQLQLQQQQQQKANNIPKEEKKVAAQENENSHIQSNLQTEKKKKKKPRKKEKKEGDASIEIRMSQESISEVFNSLPKYNYDGTGKHQSALSLRYDWNKLEPMLDFAKRLSTHQNDCSSPLATFQYRNRFGLGSDLHVWGQAACNGMALKRRIWTVGNWTWFDRGNCGHLSSPMLCYFEKSELSCPDDIEYATEHPGFNVAMNLSRPNGIVLDFCKNITSHMDKGSLRMAVVEFLFTRMTPLVIAEAERQLNMVFGDYGSVPEDLITVHIRWGDKQKEMKLVTISQYVNAIQKLLIQRSNQTKFANIYLATEDPTAVEKFRSYIPSTWNLYIDRFYVDLLSYRNTDASNNVPKMSKALDGLAGLVTLGSLLVAMEANDFVLTTASNWSRLMNELRKVIINPRCNNCTDMIDLRAPKRGEW